MGSSTFQFKQFRIQQDRCAMKVSTDGILLGAWADCEQAKTVLDIGAGTGLLSLMLAQRNPNCTIDAIELDIDAAKQCKENFEQSKWSKRLLIKQGDIRQMGLSKLYDLIICNPPYYSNSLESQNLARKLARHDTHLTLDQLIQTSIQRLSPAGKIALILPPEALEDLTLAIQTRPLNVSRLCHVHSNESKKIKRIMIVLANQETMKTEDLYIHETASREYSEQFKSLCGSFYLNL